MGENVLPPSSEQQYHLNPGAQGSILVFHAGLRTFEPRIATIIRPEVSWATHGSQTLLSSADRSVRPALSMTAHKRCRSSARTRIMPHIICGQEGKTSLTSIPSIRQQAPIEALWESEDRRLTRSVYRRSRRCFVKIISVADLRDRIRRILQNGELIFASSPGFWDIR